ncbi:metallophosphoesterase family protein [Pararhizobium gei]|uniref:metallophosphoesterase family protein n=1 Tax=Pararhizobium gei TaxID=1395951 RepID=UPI0023DA8B8F|nr:metallophosphoesterase family protein [Rhizobium gei]
MKIGVIADIHGNDLALEAVLSDLDAQGITDVVNLGDHVSGPLNAARTADILIARDHPSVRGNHDRVLITEQRETMGASDRSAYDQLHQRHIDWIASQPATRVHRGEIFMCHATPGHDETYWLEDLTPQGIIHLASKERIERFAAGVDFPVLLCGHSHIPRAVHLSDRRLLVNPGSVGCPAYDDDRPVRHKVETGSPDAAYAILSREAGHWSVSFRRASYDHRAMSRLALSRGRTEWAQGLATGWIDD